MLSIIATMPENSEDRQFISQLYEEYEGLLYATALKYTTYHLDAEEIVQDSLVRLIKKSFGNSQAGALRFGRLSCLNC